MNKTRLEAFSDAVIAIIMTIMVLELKIPHGTAVSRKRSANKKHERAIKLVHVY